MRRAGLTCAVSDSVAKPAANKTVGNHFWFNVIIFIDVYSYVSFSDVESS